MKYIIIPFIILALSGCVTAQKQCCPSQDVVIGIETPLGIMPMIIEKGYLNDENKDETWVDVDEYNEAMEEVEEENEEI